MTIPNVLTIAGSDPSGGAGIQGDLRTFEALGAAGLAVVTALTAQNTKGVDAVYPVDGAVLASQLETLLQDIRPDAVKIGMLGSAAQVEAVVDALRRYPPTYVVVDPILSSTGGVPLLDDAGRVLLLTQLLPLASLVTPNWHEAEQLTGVPLTDPNALRRCAELLIDYGVNAVLIKGGHKDGAPDDSLFTRSGTHVFPGIRIDTQHTHGTGCLLSSSIAVCLAAGDHLVAAIGKAKEIVAAALTTPTVLGGGRGYPRIESAQKTSGIKPKDKWPAAVEEVPRASGRIAGLYVLTDPTLRPDRSPEQVAAAALAGGARIIQLRDKYRSTPELIALARRLKAMTQAAGALFLVNDRVDVALASDADGVHLGPDDMHPADARRILPPHMLVGVSISTVTEARPLLPYASYLGVGAIFGTKTKSDAGAPIGLDRLREIKAAFPEIPLVAIGGINQSNIVSVVAAGADSAAAVSAVICADDMTTATQTLTAAFGEQASHQ